jgi:cytidylate kinase
MARRAAKELGFVYLDTGAIYRTVAYGVLSVGRSPEDGGAVAALLPEICVELQWDADGVQHMLLNGVDVSREIREPAVSQAASQVAAIPAVRDFLLDTQRNVAKTQRVIMDGRDIGTVVLPYADVKIFLSASAEVRALRRFKELQEKHAPDTYEEVLREMQQRDERDYNRAVAPLRKADDAIELDTSGLTLDESIAELLRIIREGIAL